MSREYSRTLISIIADEQDAFISVIEEADGHIWIGADKGEGFKAMSNPPALSQVNYEQKALKVADRVFGKNKYEVQHYDR